MTNIFPTDSAWSVRVSVELNNDSLDMPGSDEVHTVRYLNQEQATALYYATKKILNDAVYDKADSKDIMISTVTSNQ